MCIYLMTFNGNGSFTGTVGAILFALPALQTSYQCATASAGLEEARMLVLGII